MFYELRSHFIPAPYGSGSGLIIEFFLCAINYDSLSGTFEDSFYDDHIIINSLKHLNNWASKHNETVSNYSDAKRIFKTTV